MAKKNYSELAKQILEIVGGEKNVTYCTHCMTRLRFHLSDKSVVNLDAIKKLDGVIGCQWSGDQLQIIIGPTVKDLYAEVTKLGSFKSGEMSGGGKMHNLKKKN